MVREFEPLLPGGWDHGNRAFLQAFMSRGTLTFKETQAIIAAVQAAADERGRQVQPDTISEELVRAYISKAREAISPLDYDIRNTYHQNTKEQIWAIINAHSDPSTQLATSRTPDELAFIKRVLDAMFETYNTQRQEVMAVTAAQARKVARPPARGNNDEEGETQQQRAADKGLKHSEVEKLLPSLVDEGWFELSDEGYYSLSAKSLLELRAWLLDAYNDPDAAPEGWQRIKFCEACKEIVTYGQRCPDRDCNVRFHDRCAEAFWRTRRGGVKACPKCQSAWTGHNYVGERSVTESAAAHRRAGKTNGSSSRRTTMDDSAVDDEADEGEEEEDDDDDDEQ